MKLNSLINFLNVNTYVKVFVNIPLQIWIEKYAYKIGDFTQHYLSNDPHYETVWVSVDAVPIHYLRDRDLYKFFEDKLEIVGLTNTVDMPNTVEGCTPVLVIECRVI